MLIGAVEDRASKLSTLSGLSPAVKESLILMSARSRHPTDIAEAGRAVRRLLEGMHHNRVKRLLGAGFDTRSARYISEMHTTNLM